MKKSKVPKNINAIPTSQLNTLLIGARFLAFRELLGISAEKLARDLNIRIEDIKQIELGEVKNKIYIPLITSMMNEYGLSANWLTYGKGFAFSRRGPKTPRDIYRFLQRLNNPETSAQILSFVIGPIIEMVIEEKKSAPGKPPVKPARKKKNDGN